MSVKSRFYRLLIVCNISDAPFFWALLPESMSRPLEKMNELFTSNSWFVVGETNMRHRARDLQKRLHEKERELCGGSTCGDS